MAANDAARTMYPGYDSWRAHFRAILSTDSSFVYSLRFASGTQARS